MEQTEWDSLAGTAEVSIAGSPPPVSKDALLRTALYMYTTDVRRITDYIAIVGSLSVIIPHPLRSRPLIRYCLLGPAVQTTRMARLCWPRFRRRTSLGRV